jgi:hypothetical protein
MPKTVSRTHLQRGGQVAKSQSATSKFTGNVGTIPEDSKEWNFKITGKGTSGWMSWVQENGVWVPLRQSNTSFISAVAAIEPELMRLAFPHKATERKTK